MSEAPALEPDVGPLSVPTQLLAREAPPEVSGVLVRVRAGDDERLAEVWLEAGEERLVGSGSGASLRVAEATVSRRHARLVATRGRAWVEDLGATNGISVNGLRVTGAWLGPGDRVELGRVTLELGGSTAREPELGAPLPGLVGESPPMRRLAARVRRVAPLRLPVLVRGPSGSGKELVARALHELSGRRGAFVAINAATISPELAESELFGHVRGAFTGASTDRKGAFREAHGGTLFVDEVGALPRALQAKLLRAVEEGSVRPVGAEGSTRVDARVVAATCEPLEQRVARGEFREDLYERLAVSVVVVPALHERPADVPAIVAHLLEGLGLSHLRVEPSALRALRTRRYRGNVRELRNLLVQASVLAGDRPSIALEDLTLALEERAQRTRISALEVDRALERTGGNASEAARMLGVPRSTLRDRLRAGRGDGLAPAGAQKLPRTPAPWK